MPRRPRQSSAGLIFHVMNRGAKRAPLFEDSADYDAFLRILAEAVERFDVALFAYCLMRNHWHFLLSPRVDGAVSACLHWLTTTHARRWQSFRGLNGQGAVYQGRFKGVPVCDDHHFLWVSRYIERNPVRAGLVEAADGWRWSSLAQRLRQDAVPRRAAWPVPRPFDWLAYVNSPQTEEELDAVRRAIRLNEPLGSDAWRTALEVSGVARRRRSRGRPRTRRITVLEK